MIELFGTTYYMIAGGFSFFFMLFVLIILFLFLGKGTCRAFGTEWNRKKILLSMMLALFGNALLFSDVYRVGQQAEKLCAEEAGFKLYHSIGGDVLRLPVQSDTRFIKKLLERGFLSVETESRDSYKKRMKYSSGDPLRDKKTIYRFYLENDNLKKNQISDYSSGPRFFQYGENEVINRYLEKSKESIVDVETSTVYSEAILFSIYPGVVDSYIWGRIGFSFTPWFCGDMGLTLYTKTISKELK